MSNKFTGCLNLPRKLFYGKHPIKQHPMANGGVRLHLSFAKSAKRRERKNEHDDQEQYKRGEEKFPRRSRSCLQ